MSEPGMNKIAGADPQNEIDPTALFAGYQALAPLGGDRKDVMSKLEDGYAFKAAAPESRIEDIILKAGPTATPTNRLG